ncbi:glycosyl transferase [filamentous cyanobacterium CCP5]|nr:glycosyl transferase [filamentous cyanobacterium CCP5]
MVDFFDAATTDEDSPDIEDFPGYEGRRRKAALILVTFWSATLVLHISPWGSWLVWGLIVLMVSYIIRVLLAQPLEPPSPLPSSRGERVLIESESVPDGANQGHDWPFVSILVAAKNEESVITKLVDALCALDYPVSRYDLWMIDDNSSDRTPQILDRLVVQYPQLNVVHRDGEATGGKSGALNQVWPCTQGDVLVVFDADAKVPNDLLRRVVPMFEQPNLGAVQVRKAISNAATNFWTRGQQAEMALDTFFQKQRIAIGGIGELRGNGQFVRRQALAQSGGWNEATITDDLDLTIRLHTGGWNIQFLVHPAVGEEGVTQPMALWHQRNRWAEGGYQRYLDYWRLIISNRMGLTKTLDLSVFWIIQYGLPLVALPDFWLSLVLGRLPIFLPISGLAFGLSLVGMYQGLRRTHPHLSSLQATTQTLRGTLYMLHWLLVIAMVTLRLSVRPKRLRWVKTTHIGLEDEFQMDAS